jgi:hypothetical protein
MLIERTLTGLDIRQPDLPMVLNPGGPVITHSRHAGYAPKRLVISYLTAMASMAAMVSRESRRAFSIAATTQRSSLHAMT